MCIRDSIITIHTITPVGKQYEDSAYVHVSELILNYNQVKLQYVKSVSPDENQNIISVIFISVI